MIKTKYFFLLFICSCVYIAYGQEYNVSNSIVLNDQNRNAGITAVFQEETPINSAWDRGQVVSYSNDPNNLTNLGKFVTIEYEMGFEFEGSFMSQGRMIIIFSNLSEINVTEESIISVGTLIGKTKKGTGNDLLVFILSETENLFFYKCGQTIEKQKLEIIGIGIQNFYLDKYRNEVIGILH